eukprot:1160840-Pelagomonas_calceolata.AAC.9
MPPCRQGSVPAVVRRPVPPVPVCLCFGADLPQQPRRPGYLHRGAGGGAGCVCVAVLHRQCMWCALCVCGCTWACIKDVMYTRLFGRWGGEGHNLLGCSVQCFMPMHSAKQVGCISTLLHKNKCAYACLLAGMKAVAGPCVRGAKILVC